MSRADVDSPPADTMRERADAGRLKMWFLLTGNRLAVAAVILLIGWAILVALAIVGPSSMRKLVTTELAGGLFGSVLIAVVTTVTLVLTVSQLILSEEIRPLGEERAEMDEELTFKGDVEQFIAVPVSPPGPASFMRELVEAVRSHARELESAAAESPSDEGTAEIRQFAEIVERHGEMVAERLEDREFGGFNVLEPILDFNYAWKLFAARDLRNTYADAHGDDVEEAFAGVVGALGLFGTAREFFKSLYFQWEIIDISRTVLYSSIPPLAIVSFMNLAFDPSAVPGWWFGLSGAFLFTSVAFGVALSPFAVLLAYLLRVLTVVRRTLAVGPFILRPTEQAVRADREGR